MLRLRMATLVSIVCFAVLFSTEVFSQTRIDSLIKVRDSEIHDTLKVKTDIRIGRELEQSDFDSAQFYYQRALKYSQREELNDFPRFKGVVLENIGFSYIYAKRQGLKGVSFMKRALASHQKKKLLKDALATEFNIGFFYGAMLKYDSALFHYNNVIVTNAEQHTFTKFHESYNNAGLLYFYKGNNARSIEYLLKAIEIRKEVKDLSSIHDIYLNLGNNYNTFGEYETAKSYFRQSIKISDSLGIQRDLSTGYENMATSLVNQDSLDKANAMFKKAFEIGTEAGIPFLETRYYNHLAKIAELKGDLDEAHQYANKSFENFAPRVSDRHSAGVMLRLGSIKLQILEKGNVSKSESQKLLEEAIELGTEARKRAKRSGIDYFWRSSAQLLFEAYQKKGNYKEALEFNIEAYELSNEINDKSKSQAIAFATTEFETDKIEADNALLKEAQRVQDERLRQQRTIISSVVIALILIVIIAIVIYRGRLLLQKANTQIEKSLSEKDLLLKEIHHRVKNNLQVISSLLDLQSREIDDEKALSTFMEGQSRVKAMALIHEKLYQNENLETIDFTDYLNQLTKELASIYPSSKGVVTNIQSNASSAFDIDTAIPLGLILNELISNAYKYAFQSVDKGELNISLESLGEGQHQLTVKDSGKGLPVDFDISKAKSLGLRLVRRLAKQLYGTVSYAENKGAEFVIRFTETEFRRAI